MLTTRTIADPGARWQARARGGTWSPTLGGSGRFVREGAPPGGRRAGARLRRMGPAPPAG